MNSDNNQEMFPIVDEQGNITGAATRGECIMVANSCTRSFTFTFLIPKANCICRNVPNGKIFSRESGILP